MDSSTPEFRRPRHAAIMGVLRRMDAAFLLENRCFLSGGTAAAMELGEYRRAEGMRFLTEGGFSAIRCGVAHNSFGPVFREQPDLAREVRPDQFGVRSFVNTDDGPIKLEILWTHAPPGVGAPRTGWPVPLVGRRALVTGLVLALFDLGSPKRAYFRNLVDLAFTSASWGNDVLADAMATCEQAFGERISEGLATALRLALDHADAWAECMRDMSVCVDDPRMGRASRWSMPVRGARRTKTNWRDWWTWPRTAPSAMALARGARPGRDADARWRRAGDPSPQARSHHEGIGVYELRLPVGPQMLFWRRDTALDGAWGVPAL